jgi:hypothetical protein
VHGIASIARSHSIHSCNKVSERIIVRLEELSRCSVPVVWRTGLQEGYRAPSHTKNAIGIYAREDGENTLLRRRVSCGRACLLSLLIVLVVLSSLAVPVHAASVDLTVDSVWLEKASNPGQAVASVAPSDQFNIVASVKNIGDAPASGYIIDVYYDSDFGRGGPDNIAPGEVQIWYVGPLTAQDGTHTAKWIVDPDNQIAELDENNNQRDYVSTVGSQTTTTTTTTSNSTSSSTFSSTTNSTSTPTSSSTQSTSTSTSSTAQSTSTSTSSTESTGSTTTITTTSTFTSTSQTAPATGPTLGPALRMTTNKYASQSPSLAASDSYVYVAWSDNVPVAKSGGQPEVWLRVSSNSGASFGSAIRISTNTGASVSPSVAASGSYVYVAWSDNTPVSGSGSDYEVWVCMSSNNGGRFGSAIRISANTGWSGQPSVAATGNYVYVAWSDNTPVTGSGGMREVWMRASSNNGRSFGPAIRITTNTGTSENPSVAAVGSYVYVAWDDDTSVTGSGGKDEIWMRVSSNNGASFGSAIRITTNTGSSINPSVAAVGSNVYVAWQDDTPVAGSGDKPGIWLRTSLNSGGSFGGATCISTDTGRSSNPSAGVSGSYVYVAWEDDSLVTGSGGQPEVWLRVSSNSGASFGSAIRISTNTGASVSPSVAASGSYVYVAWSDNTPVSGSGSQPEIWIRVGK